MFFRKTNNTITGLADYDPTPTDNPNRQVFVPSNIFVAAPKPAKVESSVKVVTASMPTAAGEYPVKLDNADGGQPPATAGLFGGDLKTVMMIAVPLVFLGMYFKGARS